MKNRMKNMANRFRRIALQKSSIDLNEGIEFLGKNLEINSQWLNDIIHLKSRNILLQKRYNQGIVAESQYNIEYNKLIKSLIDQVEDISQQNPVFKNHNIYCRLIYPDKKEIDYPVFHNDEIKVGRSEDSDIRLELQNISRNHCKILINHPIFRVKDLNSTNGTFVNGARIKNSVLKVEDEIQVGDYTIKILDLLKTKE